MTRLRGEGGRVAEEQQEAGATSEDLERYERELPEREGL